MRRISEIVGERYMNSVPAKRAVPSLLRQLRERGVKMCAATSNKHDLAEGALKRLGLWEYLDFLITCDEIGCGKENPDIYIYCAKRLGLSPSEIMVFEDALHGAECAKNAGFAVTGVFDEGAGEDFHKIAGFADHTVNFNGEEAVFH